MTALLSYATVNDFPVLDPLSLSRQSAARGTSDIEWRELANSVVIPRGKDPTVAYFLLPYDAVDAVADSVSTIRVVVAPETPEPHKEPFSGVDDIQITDMYLHATQAVMAPYDAESSVFLSEFRDARQIASMSAIDKAYNVHSPYYADRDDTGVTTIDYWYSTTNSGAAWSWREMLDDIWGMIPILGAVPDYSKSILPAEPPSNYRFHGWSAWDAFNKALLDVGNYVVPNVFRETAGENPWMVIAESTEGAVQESLSAARAVPTDLSHPRTLTATRVPEKVKVVFPSRTYDFAFDTDDGVVSSRDSFESSPTHVETVNNPNSTGTIAGTEVILRDSMAAFYDIPTGTLVNSSKLADRANHLATEYFKLAGEDDVQDRFSGLHRIVPDHGIKSTTFYDFGLGWQTQIEHDFHTRMAGGGQAAHYHQDETKTHVPYHRACYVRITTAVPSGSVIAPGQIGKGNVYWFDPTPAVRDWVQIIPAREVYFFNGGLGDISIGAATFAYLEYWWQTRAFITFCAFEAT